MRYRAPILATLLAALPSALPGQGVTGTVVDQQSGAPIPGALVSLVSSDGRTHARVLADRAGAFSLRAPSAGRYTLRAERIGYATASSPPLELAAGQVVAYRLAASAERVQLEALVATGGGDSRRCTVRPRAGEETAALWDEARKALQSAVTTRQQYPYRFRTERRVRQLDPATLTVRREEVRAMEGLSDNPFVSVGAERLAAHGYVETVGDTVFFHAPDAAVLLSDPFLEGHCFRSQRPDGDHAGMVGLAFEPVRAGEQADVAGVLWLDARTAELRTVDYRYTRGSAAAAVNERAGGRVEFRRLPNGAWIVSRWRILMPAGAAAGAAAAAPTGAPMPVLQTATRVALAEEAGQVVEVRARDGSPVEMAAFASITGTVFDSTRNRPLAGARVSLAATADSTRTDAEGRFTLPRVAEGAYALVFAHPRLDSLHFTPEGAPVTVVPPEALRRDLAIPPLAAVLAAQCHTPPGSAVGAVAGIVSERGGGAALPGVPVTAEWRIAGVAEPGRAAAVSDEIGGYRFCDVPAGAAVRVAARLADDSAAAEVQARAGAATQQDLALTAPAGFAAAAAGAVRVTVRVVDPAGGRPIEGMQVHVAGLPAATTDRRGAVVFPAVAPGSYAVELDHRVYGTATARLTVHGPGAAEFELAVPRRTVTLDAVHATARRVYPGDFNQRSRGRRLNVITREQIEARQGSARDVGDLVAAFSMLHVTDIHYPKSGMVKEVCVTDNSGPRASPFVTLQDREDRKAEQNALRGISNQNLDRIHALMEEQCQGVGVAVDDMIMAGQAGEFLKSFPIGEIESVIYLRPGEATARFGGFGANGVILIYTRGNGPTVQN
jgi:hypothetical protein